MISAPTTNTNFQNNIIVPAQNPSMNSGKVPMQNEESIPPEYQIPEDVLSVLPYYDGFTTKFYMYGFLNKKNESTPDGKLFKMRDWTRWYVELCGPVLIFWRATPEYTMENVERLKSLIAPNFLNVSDCIVNTCQNQDDRQFVFSLNTSGANRFYMEAGDSKELNDWVCAIRLSSYEMAKLHEMYTYVILTRSDFSHLFSTYHSFTEGYLQIKYAGASQWRRCWAVLDNEHVTPQGPQIQFFEDPHAGSLFNLSQVTQAYSVYPERPELSDVSGIFKVEGTVDISLDYNAIRPEFIIMSAESPEDMARWVVAIFDAYKLFGRPEQLHIPPAPTDTHSLYLQVSQVNHLDMSRNDSVDCKHLFEKILVGEGEPLHEQMMDMHIENVPKVTRTKSSVSFAASTKKNGKKPKAILPSDSEESEEEEVIEESESDDEELFVSKTSVPQPQEKTIVNTVSEPADLKVPTPSNGNLAPKALKAKKQLASDSEEASDTESHQSDEHSSPEEPLSLAVKPSEPEPVPEPESVATASVPKARKLKAKAVLPSDSEESEEDEDDDDDHPVFAGDNKPLQTQQHPVIAFTGPESDMSREVYNDPRFANSANQFQRPPSAIDPRSMSHNVGNPYAQDVGRRDQMGRQFSNSTIQSEYDPRYAGWEGPHGSSVYSRDPNMEAEERWRREEMERRRYDMGPPSPTMHSMYGAEDEMPIGGFNPMDRRQMEQQRLTAMRGNSMYAYGPQGNPGMGMPMNMPMNNGPGYYGGSTYMDDSGFDYQDPAFGYSPYQSRMEPMGLLAAHDAARMSRFEQPRHGPLIQVDKKKVTHQVGLIGAIAAREQYKAIHKYTNANSGSAMLELAREREEALEREKERMLMEQRQQIYYQEELRRRMGAATSDRGYMYPTFNGAPSMSGMMRPGSNVYIPEGSDEEDNQTLASALPGQRYSSPHAPQQTQSFYGAQGGQQHLSISPQYPSRLSAPLSNDTSPLGPGGRHSYMDAGSFPPASPRPNQSVSPGYPANQRPASSFASTTSSSNVSPASSRYNIESIATGPQNSFAPPRLPEISSQPLGMSSLSSAIGASASDDVDPSGSESEEEDLPKSSSQVADKFEEFIDDKVEMKPYSFVDSQQLYDSYLSWCRVKRLPPNAQAGPGQMEALMIENGFTKKKKKDASPDEEPEQWYNITIV
ncbi:hypothetical protein K7432_004328 [Basidiobolus ranarum]|uniref:PH domain-containing protein n=1 Tax=Basidiobolus ranarum TaxID=34480 RepID=A0ABR2WYJ1_9FUNG